jgi:hypothetical protein
MASVCHFTQRRSLTMLASGFVTANVSRESSIVQARSRYSYRCDVVMLWSGNDSQWHYHLGLLESSFYRCLSIEPVRISQLIYKYDIKKGVEPFKSSYGHVAAKPNMNRIGRGIITVFRQLSPHNWKLTDVRRGLDGLCRVVKGSSAVNLCYWHYHLYHHTLGVRIRIAMTRPV